MSCPRSHSWQAVGLRLHHISRILLALWAVEVNWDAEHGGTVLTAAHRVCVVKEKVLMWGQVGESGEGLMNQCACTCERPKSFGSSDPNGSFFGG